MIKGIELNKGLFHTHTHTHTHTQNREQRNRYGFVYKQTASASRRVMYVRSINEATTLVSIYFIATIIQKPVKTKCALLSFHQTLFTNSSEFTTRTSSAERSSQIICIFFKYLMMVKQCKITLDLPRQTSNWGS